MPAGALDAQGVWQYGTSDAAAPADVLLNKLAASVSTALIGPIATTTKLASTPRWWQSIGITAATPAVAINTPTSVLPAPINIANLAAGSYKLDAYCAAYAGSVAAATVQFRVNGVTVHEPRNDLSAGIGIMQSHGWVFDHAGGPCLLDLRLLCVGVASTYQTQGTGLILSRIL